MSLFVIEFRCIDSSDFCLQTVLNIQLPLLKTGLIRPDLKFLDTYHIWQAFPEPPSQEVPNGRSSKPTLYTSCLKKKKQFMNLHFQPFLETESVFKMISKIYFKSIPTTQLAVCNLVVKLQVFNNTASFIHAQTSIASSTVQF